MSEQILRAALIGCGSVAQRGILPHLSQPDARERVHLVAVADTVTERARLTAERFGIPDHFTEIDALLDNVEVDVVLIATPIATHFPNALAAIERGKHVYVQKAMTTTLAEANRLLEARDQACVRLAAAPGYELFPTTHWMRDIVSDGTLGPVYVAYTYTLGFGHEHEPIRAGQGALHEIDPTWYYRRGAGPVPDVTVYALQLLTSVLGPVRRVTALANMRRGERTWRDRSVSIEEPDNNVVSLEFVSGAIGVAVGADCRGGSQPWGGMSLHGSAGTLEVKVVDGASGYPLRFDVQADTMREYTATLADQPYLRGEHLSLEEPHIYADIMDLADAIRDNRPPYASGEQARHVVEIIECARNAAITGKTQDISTTFAPVHP